MDFLEKKRNFVSSKLTFKSKNKISPIIIQEKKKVEDNNDNIEIQSTIPLQEDNKEKKVFKEFISENDLKKGLIPQKSYSKLSKIDPLPKEYKIYKKIIHTDFEKKHLTKIEKWNFDYKYEKYQKLLTSLPEFNEMPRISGA